MTKKIVTHDIIRNLDFYEVSLTCTLHTFLNLKWVDRALWDMLSVEFWDDAHQHLFFYLTPYFKCVSLGLVRSDESNDSIIASYSILRECSSDDGEFWIVTLIQTSVTYSCVLIFITTKNLLKLRCWLKLSFELNDEKRVHFIYRLTRFVSL